MSANTNRSRAAHEKPTFLRVRNWDRFQHYKDRRPPWIKLHQSLADDFAFNELPDHSKVQLMSLWILASKHDNKFPDQGAGLERHNLSHRPFDMGVLVDAGFLETFQEETDVSPANVSASTSLSLARSQESEAETEEVLDVGEELSSTNRSWFRRLG